MIIPADDYGMTMSSPNTVPAGWYPDSSAPGQVRWWDGAQWTAHTQPDPTVPQPQPQPMQPQQPPQGMGWNQTEVAAPVDQGWGQQAQAQQYAPAAAQVPQYEAQAYAPAAQPGYDQAYGQVAQPGYDHAYGHVAQQPAATGYADQPGWNQTPEQAFGQAAPAQSWGQTPVAPQQSFAYEQQQYTQPQAVQPQQQYAQPDQAWGGQPQQGYAAQPQGYAQPEQAWGGQQAQPQQGYAAQPQGYAQPEQAWGGQQAQPQFAPQQQAPYPQQPQAQGYSPQPQMGFGQADPYAQGQVQPQAQQPQAGGYTQNPIVPGTGVQAAWPGTTMAETQAAGVSVAPVASKANQLADLQEKLPMIAIIVGVLFALIGVLLMSGIVQIGLMLIGAGAIAYGVLNLLKQRQQ
jgi:Protein of unknown function (DUF2510)